MPRTARARAAVQGPGAVRLRDDAGRACDGDVAQLLAECRGEDTARARYVVSVIESALQRKRERAGPA
ncbi:hypothetical protein [Tahibacter caeni]|uniref:hypothetical protein n=1 Tax=Tahibacter caeni TaxID=1453545 RepID=UPI00214764D9|nr:hypothetical protein [Tahibacter caeni]